MIEQQQILTTQNLATLFSISEVREQLKINLSAMTERTFGWLVDELAVDRPDWHSRLIAVKSAAYAWRQMVFYLSILPPDQWNPLIDRMDAATAKHRSQCLVRFRPALAGLKNVVDGRSVGENGGKRFVGWSTSRHRWLEASVADENSTQ